MSNVVTVKSPGRINIIGEHTDYNMGYVLPAAIDRYTEAIITLNGTEDTVCFTSIELDDSYSYKHLSSTKHPIGWHCYLVGVVAELKRLGARFKGFDATINTTIPLGSGMSSSAALECSLAYALNSIFDLRFDKMQLIKVCQNAEHNFVGTKCGIMDQYASIMGKKDTAILLNCKDLTAEHYPLELGEYEFLLLNTNVAHNLATAAYNQRRKECEYGVQLIQSLKSIQSLSDCDMCDLENVQSIMPSTIYKRCRHVITENSRVLSACKALSQGNLDQLGSLMYASHQSLSTDYEVSCEELDYLVELSKDNAKIAGSRMMGGGFGGCTINLIHKNFTQKYIDYARNEYHAKFKLELTPYQVNIEDGTHIVTTP